MATEPEPGSWGIREVEPPDPYEVERLAKALSDKTSMPETASEEEPDSSLGQSVALMTRQFGMPISVIYPACGNHVIDKLFPGARIIYVDPSENGIQAIQAVIGDKARALSLTIDEYKISEKFDLLFSLNSHADTEQQLHHVKENGMVFCNNYFGTQDAERIIELGTCDLIGVVETEGDYLEPTLITSNLEGYLEPAKQLPSFAPQRRKIAYYYVFRKK